MILSTISEASASIAARATKKTSHDSPYNYNPTEYVAIIFLVLFSISILLHIAQATRYRMWWLLPTAALCGLIEIIGWSGRLWSSINPDLSTPFTMQITCTIIAPTPLVAANFIILGRIIRMLGASYSRLRPMTYTIVFCSFDVVSLVVQGVGGGLASVASQTVGGNPSIGGHIMLAGIAFQLATITVYVICATDFFVRYLRDSPIRPKDGQQGVYTRPLKIMTAALIFNTTCLFIRSIYRVIELAGGWNGPIISTQRYFNVLDGAMVVLAIYTLNFAHPGLVLGSERNTEAKEKQGLVGTSRQSQETTV